MFIDLEKLVTEKNFIYLLDLISNIEHGVSIVGIFGDLTKVPCIGKINNNSLESHSNVFKLNNLYSDDLQITNNTLKGKYNVIELFNIKGGEYEFIIEDFNHIKNNEELMETSKLVKINDINKIFKKLFSLKNNIIIIENIDSKEDIIIDFDLDTSDSKIIYFKNVKTSKNIIIKYSSNNITAIFEGVNQNVIFKNDFTVDNLCKENYSILSSDKFVKEEKEIEEFSNSNSNSKLLETIVMIALIYLIFKMMFGKKEIIKLNL